MRKLSGAEENRILSIAAELNAEGDVWVNSCIMNESFVSDNRPLIEVYNKDRCRVHNLLDLGWRRIRIPFFFNDKEYPYYIRIPIGYCKYCKKLYLPVKYFDRYIDKGYFLCRLSKDNIIINDLTEKDVNDIREERTIKEIKGLCSVEKEKANNLLNIEKKRAEIPVIRADGEIEYINVPIYYSRNTNCCYIYNETVEWLKQKGVILCRMFKASIDNENDTKGDFSGLNTESIIHQFGYNVSEEANLTVNQRRRILLHLIRQRIVSIEDIKNHLSFLINVNGKMLKMRNACDKWRQDFEYLDNLEEGLYNTIFSSEYKIKKIILVDDEET